MYQNVQNIQLFVWSWNEWGDITHSHRGTMKSKPSCETIVFFIVRCFKTTYCGGQGNQTFSNNLVNIKHISQNLYNIGLEIYFLKIFKYPY